MRITAEVYVPSQDRPSLGLQARLSSAVFRKGEQAAVTVRVDRDAGVAIFNITADDRLALLFPNAHEPDNAVAAGRELVFPAKDAKVLLEMQTLPGHQRDAEAFLILAWERAISAKLSPGRERRSGGTCCRISPGG